jgi:hypothetical protein
MARISTSEQVPKPTQDTFNAIVALTDAFCRAHLDDEYAQLARQATAACVANVLPRWPRGICMPGRVGSSMR